MRLDGSEAVLAFPLVKDVSLEAMTAVFFRRKHAQLQLARFLFCLVFQTSKKLHSNDEEKSFEITSNHFLFVHVKKKLKKSELLAGPILSRRSGGAVQTDKTFKSNLLERDLKSRTGEGLIIAPGVNRASRDFL